MTDRSSSSAPSGLGRVAEELPTERLVAQAQNLLGALGERGLSMAADKIGKTTERLADYAENSNNVGAKAGLSGGKALAEGKSPLRAALSAGATGAKEKVKSVLGGGKGGGKGKEGKKKLKMTNIVEDMDVGAPLRVVYDQWTQFGDFPGFMKKVEVVEQKSDEKLDWKAQVFWSHRHWQATIIEQVPDELIVWQSKGDKGHVDGAVTFHEITPNLTKILVVLQYHPQGFFEHTGNLWRAQGRRVRLELKHFRRHVMTQVLLHPDEIEGWRGEIRDGEVVRTHEDAVDEEEEREAGDGHEGFDEEDSDDMAGEGSDEDEYPEDEDEDEDAEDDLGEQDEGGEEEEPEDEHDEGEDEYEEEQEEEEPEDEYEDDEDEYEEEQEGEEPEDEYDDDASSSEDEEFEDEAPARRHRKRSPAGAR